MARTIGWFLHWNRTTESPESDAELLRRFAFDKEPGTLEALMHRHGGLVLGTCERILRDTQLAEDAFQATFLVLAKRAGTVRGLLPAWLHKVAQRLCWRMIRKHRATVAHRTRPSTCTSDYEQQELLAVLDEEIARLPAKHRSVIQLCYLQDRTAETAGQLLGIPRGTVLSRLDSARRKLQKAFARRGITSLAILTIPTLAVSVSPALTATAAGVARGLASPSASAVVSMALTELTMMKLRTWIICWLVAVWLLGVGSTVLVMQKAAAGDTAKKPEDAKEEKKDLHVQRLALARQRDAVDAMIANAQIRRENLELAILLDGISEKTLRAAIENEEIKMLQEESSVLACQRSVEVVKKMFEKEIEINLVSNHDAIKFHNAVLSLHKMTKTKDWPKDYDPVELVAYAKLLPTTDLVADIYNFICQTRRDASNSIVAKYKPLLVKDYQRQKEDEIKLSEGKVKAAQSQLASTKERRDGLIKRLYRSNKATAELPKDDDDVQLYRESRKALTRKMQMLELEIAGVKLP